MIICCSEATNGDTIYYQLPFIKNMGIACPCQNGVSFGGTFGRAARPNGWAWTAMAAVAVVKFGPC